MQNYEVFLDELESLQKPVKDGAAAAVRKEKAISKSLNEGNMNEAKKGMAELEEMVRQLSASAGALREKIASFDVQEYFVSGDFTEQLLKACDEKGINVKGEKGVYEMFPNKVRILGDQEHPGEVWLDRKKVASCRPQQVAETIQKGQEKLYKSTFKAEAFMDELVAAYEITCLVAGGRKGASQGLEKVYKQLVPMARTRKEYDKQAFAFDLARLYEMGRDAWVTKDGKRFDFGTGREGSGYRVLSRTGTESYISTMKLVNTAE